MTANGQNPKPLTPEERRVIVEKGTEAPFTGQYDKHTQAGTYVCRQCGAPLYRSSDKFDAGCGWPSFDDQIEGAVRRTLDADGRRTEITCAKCGGHLGHVFTGEGFTPLNTRHCVNSVSLSFVPAEATTAKSVALGNPAKADGSDSADPTRSDVTNSAVSTAKTTASSGQTISKTGVPVKNVASVKPIATAQTETAIFAGGCFWGVEYLLAKVAGVRSVESGYIGGKTENPTYEQVCSRRTGHAEAVRVIFDPSQVSYETLAKLFFEIHDPTQIDRQGPDIGDQYRSEVFYTTPAQKQTAEKLVAQLRAKGYDVATQITPATRFWPAEGYHQDYYDRKGSKPYCHAYTKRF